MTRSTLVKRIAWTAALLALPMFAMPAYAGDHGNRHGEKHGAPQTQQHHESGHHKSRNVGKHHNVSGGHHGFNRSRHGLWHRSSFSHFGGYRSGYHSNHSSHSGIGFRISFGSYDRGHRVYSQNYYDRSCCTSGYYTTRWVEPVTSYRYDQCNRPYPVVIRTGYYKQVWIPGRCSRGIHSHGGGY